MATIRRILICGDLHTKTKYLPKLQELSKKVSRTILLGDYCDDWNAYPEHSYELIYQLHEWKQKAKGKLILLLGNHDLSEWFGGEFRCSGWNFQTNKLVSYFFEKNQQDFEISFAVGNTLFTHAGLTQDWTEQNLPIDKKPQKLSFARFLSCEMNLAFRNRDKKFLSALRQVGYERGGYSHSTSPIWADYNELISSPFPSINQIVGHTPVTGITEITTSSNNQLIFCDTLSTYLSHGKVSPYGDQTVIIYDMKTKTYEIIPLTD